MKGMEENRMIPGIFVTGTGTDVGKTITVAGLMRRLLRHGVDAMMMKPVQTGAYLDATGHATAPDIDFVLQATGLTVDDKTMHHLAPYLYEPACSPHLAARLAGRPIRLEVILESARVLAERHRLLVVEGAGGLMVPLNESETMLDLAAVMSMPVLLVGHSGLGTINHVLLSLEALRSRNLKILGVILNDTRSVAEHDRFIYDDNLHAIQSFGNIRVLARIPWLGAPPDTDLLDRALGAWDLHKEL